MRGARSVIPRTASRLRNMRRQPTLPPDFSSADTAVWNRVAPYTMTSPERILACRRAVEYVVARRLPGAIVECGVWRGGSMMAIALTLLELGVTDRELWLYDTFVGMTEPTEADADVSGASATRLLATAAEGDEVWARSPLEEVRENALSTGYPAKSIGFVEGRVEETLPAQAPAEIALLRLDTDWYESTRHELTPLYPRL